MSSQNFNKIQIFTEIEQLYPDIEGQLENRHCSLYGKIKVKFQKYYPQMIPQYFISIKGILDILKVNCTPFTVSMALQNGVIMAVSKTYKDQKVFINSSYLEQQIILSHKGQIIENNNKSSLAQWAKIGFQIALSNSLKNNLYGAIIYLQNNIPEDSFKYKQAHILGFTLACLIVNDLTDQFSMQQIEQKMKQVVQKRIPLYHAFDNNVLLITDGQLCHNLKISQNNWKFIICEIDLQQLDIKKLKERKQLIKMEQKLLQKLLSNALNQQHKSLMDLKRQYQIETMQQIQNFGIKYINKDEYTLTQYQQILGSELYQFQNYNKNQILFNPKKRLITATLQYNFIQKLVNNPNKQGFKNAIKQSYQMLAKQKTLSQKQQNLIKFCLNNQALACTTIDNKYLLILIQKNKMLKLFQLVKKKVFIINSDIQKPQDKGIHHLIFSTLPSKGAAILLPDPETQLWFE